MKRLPIVIITLLACISLAACKADAAAPTSQTSQPASESTNAQSQSSSTEQSDPTTDEPTDLGEFTTGQSQSEGWPDIAAQALPVDARFGSHDGFERFVVQYDDPDGTLEWYTDGWVDQATQDGSGFAIDTNSERQLQIVVSGMRYPSETEETGEGITGFFPAEGILSGADIAGIFEGQHTITVGANADHPYRITTLNNPTRIVIDIAH